MDKNIIIAVVAFVAAFITWKIRPLFGWLFVLVGALFLYKKFKAMKG